MSDLPPRRPITPEEEREQELSASAYEATVPGRMGGFRGTNPIAFVVAGVLSIAIILFAVIAFFNRGSAADPARTAQVRAQQEAQPAAPGLGGAAQAPFIPESSPRPFVTYAPGPIIPVSQILPPTPIPIQRVQEPPPLPPPSIAEAPPPIVPAPAAAGVDTKTVSDEMKIAQPKNGSGGVAQTAASAEALGTHYIPVYRNGQLVSLEEVANTPKPQLSTASAATPATVAAQPQSAQFVSENTNTQTGLGAGNAGLLEARKYTNEKEQNSKVGYVAPGSDRQLTAATVLNARLMSKIESDLPGPVIAQITQPIYDTNTHSIVVVPAGTRVFGTYDEETVASSTRLLLAFNKLIFPDGEEFDIGGQPATDSIGTSGLAGDVDKHRGSLYSSAILLSVLGGAQALLSPQQSGGLTTTPSISQQAQSAAGAQLNQLTTKLLDRAVDRPSTIIVRPPFAFQIVVMRDLPLQSYVAQHQ